MGSDSTTVALAVAGVVALATAFVWRQSVRRSRRARLIRRFASPMAERRARAGVELVDLGLSRAARAILAHVPEEDDPRVRHEIALAVARRQWEPAGGARVAELREWARAELEHQGYDVVGFGPAFTRLSDMGGPRLPEREPESPVDAEPQAEAAVERLHWTPSALSEPVVSAGPSVEIHETDVEERATTPVAAPQPS